MRRDLAGPIVLIVLIAVVVVTVSAILADRVMSTEVHPCDPEIVTAGVPEQLHDDYLARCWEELRG